MHRRFSTALAQFNAKLIKLDNGCWILSSEPMPTGYSRFKQAGISYYAHIFAYENFVGPVPKDMELHHKCLYRRCCNPEHVEPLTRSKHKLKELKDSSLVREELIAYATKITS